MEILVTGASGHLGRRVIHHLLESDRVPSSRIVAATRNPAGLADLAARGIAVRRADFNDPPSLETAFAGAEAILIISTDEFDLVGGKRLKQQEAAVAAAKKAGAAHVLYTSMLRPEPGSPVLFASDHYGTEQAMKASGMSYTIFRDNAYHENLLGTLPAIVASGRWYTSAGEGRTAYAARDDMAAAIAGRLASGATDSATYFLTGPKAYSNADVAALVTEVTGRPIEIAPLSDAALTDVLKIAGVPDDWARFLASVDANVRAGNNDLVNDTIEALSSRRPTPLKRFLEANSSALTGQSLPSS